MTEEKHISAKGFKIKATAIFVPVLVIASLIVPFFMDGIGKPTIGQRLTGTFLIPWRMWAGLAYTWPFLTVIGTLPFILLLGAGIWRPSRTLFVVSLLGIAGLWLYLVWLSWTIRYA